jgi:hypothetical protein
MNHIRLTAEDREWNGSRTIKAGRVCVSSAYGGDGAPISDEGQAEAVALKVFERIVRKKYPATAKAEFRAARPYSARH